jgi:hypothetical protein
VTLGRLGAAIEFSIHNRMHLAWAAEQADYRPSGTPFDVAIQLVHDYLNERLA